MQDKFSTNESIQKIESYSKTLCSYLQHVIQYKSHVSIQHIKIFLTGSAAAGKTSFRHLLLGSPFSKHQTSTDVLESRVAYAIHNSASLLQLEDSQDLIWYQHTPNQQLIYFKSLLGKIYQAETIESNPNVDDSAKSDDSIATDTTYEPMPLVERMLSSDMLPESLHIGETVKIITIIDTGGQPGYIHLLPAIVNCPTINFIVHDMTKDLEDPVQVWYKKEGHEQLKPYQLSYSHKELIKLIMSLSTESLEISSDNPINNTSAFKFISFVGTHKDKVSDPGRITSLNEQLNNIVKQQNCKVDVLNFGGGNILFPVDNTTAGKSKIEDNNVKIIRKKIEDVMQGMDSYPLPITWMILELELQELRDKENCSCITVEEYTNIARNSASIVNEDEIKNSLKYYHFLEVLLYFDEIPGLCDYVILDQQWFYNKVSMFVHSPSEMISFIRHDSQALFEISGILLKDECRSIKWNEKIKIEHLISYLVHKHIIADFTWEKKQYYYLPYILPYCQQYHDKHQFLLSEPLLIQFSNGILPRGFFCSLVVHLLQHLPSDWHNDLLSSTGGAKKHFKNIMTFCLPDNFFLRMQDKIYYLELQIRHFKDNKLENAFYHPQVLPKFQKYLNMVCQKLRFDSKLLQYGFLCHDRESIDDDHIAVIPSLDTPLPLKLHCSKKCKNQTTIGRLHTIWFDKIRVKGYKQWTTEGPHVHAIVQHYSGLGKLANILEIY